MSKKIRFAVVGMGHIGKRHAEMIRRNPDTELVAVADIRSSEECGLIELEVPFYPSINALLKDEKKNIDVLNICTPNGLHATMAIQALENDLHVVIEKPMTLCKLDAETIIHQSQKKGKHVFCVMQNRYSPPAVWLKNIIEQQLLGEIYQVQINCFWNRDKNYYTGENWHGDAKLDGGTLFTQFSHFIDIMYWLFGDIKNISGRFNDFKHKDLTAFEDSGFVSFDFVKEGTGSFNYSTALYNENLESSMIIIAEKGTVKIAGQYMNEVAYCNIADYTMPKLEAGAPPNDYGAYKGSAQNHHFVIRNVVEKLNNTSAITTNAQDGMKVVDIIERIYKERDKQWKK